MKRVCALRGATKVLNDASDIEKQVAALYDEMLCENGICEDDVISLIFSVTTDITAKNPAAALRAAARGGELSLFCCAEPQIDGAPPATKTGFIRALMHCYLDENLTPHHIYRNGAQILRPDRTGTSPLLA
jgi:chorismate mutase